MRKIVIAALLISLSGCDDAKSSPPPIPPDYDGAASRQAGTWQLIEKIKDSKGDVTQVLLFNTADGEVCKIYTIDDDEMPTNKPPVRCYSANDYITDRKPPKENGHKDEK
ncbi:hypothetical protein FEI17_10410 [Kosakonia radicincitans]|uniref:hypothetical protein n=1 Tax=Kosakonia radicincitans TaxID=283686 RepID=UPI0004614BDF|nr:hypothetical protein [Kosakonia radicincitans]KDE37460.1 hypothetical protein AW40_06945 [Kosakonia radicincitans UMEnt01/12]QEM91017.1 hypothetical protein FEI17_10410 [Kosakonia radicincitans]